jgi:hypothetical protein
MYKRKLVYVNQKEGAALRQHESNVKTLIKALANITIPQYKYYTAVL